MSEALVRGARDVAQSLYGVLVPEQSQQRNIQNDSDDESGPQPEFNMRPPPDGAFDSREKLLEYLKNWAQTEGYAVVIGRSRTNRLWIRCDRGGAYHDKHAEDPSQRKRKRKVSRLTGCGFSVKASMRKDGIWRSRTENGEHNHGPSEDLRDHPSLRRMNDEQTQVVNELTEDGQTPAEIMVELTRLWPDIKVIRRDIYNARKAYKSTKEAAGQSAPREFEDPNGRMPGPTDSGRWVWAEEGDEIKKRRRVGRPPKEPESVAVSSQNLPNLQLGASNDGFASPSDRTLDLNGNTGDQHVTSWNRLSLPASESQSSSLSTPAPSFQPPPTSSSSLTNRIRSPQNEYSTGASTPFGNSTTNSYNFGASNPPLFPQQILTTSPSIPDRMASNSSSNRPSSTRQSQRLQPQAHIHPSLRTSSSASNGGNGTPAASESPAQAMHQINSQLQAAAYPPPTSRTSNTANSGGTAHRPMLSAPNGVTSEPSVGTGATSSIAPPPKGLSAAAMMQRMQRVEEIMEEQKSELRQQKDMLSQILEHITNRR